MAAVVASKLKKPVDRRRISNRPQLVSQFTQLSLRLEPSGRGYAPLHLLSNLGSAGGSYQEDLPQVTKIPGLFSAERTFGSALLFQPRLEPLFHLISIHACPSSARGTNHHPTLKLAPPSGFWRIAPVEEG